MLPDLPELLASQIARYSNAMESSAQSHASRLQYIDYKNNLDQAIVQLEYLGMLPPDLVRDRGLEPRES